jgi:hypothetical protein
MKKNFIFAALIAISFAGKSAPDDKKSVFHKVVLTEVIQTTSYTYLHAKEENDSLTWLAVPLMQAKAGETYYYTGGLSMKEFESKELHRKFDEVLFLGGVATAPTDQEKANAAKEMAHQGSAQPYKRKAVAEVRKDIKINRPQNGITIAELLSNKDAYAGKTVIIKGEVTKFNKAIMDKNWIHIQDGTEFNGKFDFVITSAADVKPGDIVTLEGKITLNKDFGYGYAFDVIMEEATTK